MKNLITESKWLNIVYFATGYGFVISSVYLFSYWSNFNINILQYIKSSDIIRIAIYPIIISVFSIIPCYLFGFFICRWSKEHNVEKSLKLKKLEKWTQRILLLQVFLFGCYCSYKYGWIFLWIWLAFLMSWFVTAILIYYKKDLVIKLIPIRGYEAMILWLFVAAPLFAFAYGKTNGLQIIKGMNCFYVDVTTFKNDELLKEQERLKYLGLKGEYLFFLSENNAKLYVIEFSKIPFLELYKLDHQKTEAIKGTEGKASKTDTLEIGVDSKW